MLFSHFFFYFVSMLGGSLLGSAPVDGLLHTLALTKGLGKKANIARARDVKLYFRLFRCVNPCVNARWSMHSRKKSMVGKRRAWARNPVSLRALNVQARRARSSWLFRRFRTAWAQDSAGGRRDRVERDAIQVYPSLPRHPLVANTMES